MSFPAPSVTPPTFTQYPTAYYNGITFGGTTSPFQIRADPGIEGLDMPTVRTGDTDAPRMLGEYVGLDLLSGRDITVTIDVGPPFGSYTNLAGAMAALRVALTPTYSTELPFYAQLPNGPQVVSMVRPRKRGTTVDIAYTLGQLAQNIPIQFHGTDPALYAAQTLSPSVGVPAPLGGFTFPLTFPLSFGGGSVAGIITATNSGDIPCWPILTFTGPMTSPRLTNSSISGTPYIQFLTTLLTGDTLVVNTDPKYRSAVYTTSGSTVGASRMYTLAQGSNWFAINPGVNTLQFTTLDTSTVAGTVVAWYSSAYSAAA